MYGTGNGIKCILFTIKIYLQHVIQRTTMEFTYFMTECEALSLIYSRYNTVEVFTANTLNPSKLLNRIYSSNKLRHCCKNSTSLVYYPDFCNTKDF